MLDVLQRQIMSLGVRLNLDLPSVAMTSMVEEIG
jgi:hypothetical protein